LDTTSPLLKTKFGNKYILVPINHNSKWCEAKAIPNRIVTIATTFLEEEIICQYGVLRFLLTNNGKVWASEFDNLCKVYGIQHQFTTLQWAFCNGMAKRKIKIIKHGVIMLLLWIGLVRGKARKHGYNQVGKYKTRQDKIGQY